eukprot:scpid47608/ scgid3672/ Putative tRNA pseudouridine synthase Pus10; Coiled-coil domain-containing protein 139; tRNA pseudouridine 55 synthase; tRNA pseudouridylate synthase; tRNA-uridine isomerase
MSLTREKKRELVAYLQSVGCCERCMLRFLKVYLPSSYMNPTLTLEALTKPSGETAEAPEQTAAGGSPALDNVSTNGNGSAAAGVDGSSAADNTASAKPSADDAPCAVPTSLEGSDPSGVGDTEPAAKYRRNVAGDREAACDPVDAPQRSAPATNDGQTECSMEVQEASNGAPAESTHISSASSSICSSCLGVLQDSWLENMVGQVHSQVVKDGYQFSSFTFSVFFPLASLVRERALVAAIADEFKTEDGVPQVKEVLKWVASPQLQKHLGVGFSLNSPFQIVIAVEHPESEQLVSVLADKCPKYFPGLARSRAKTTAAAVNVTSVTKALQAASDEDVKSWYTCPLAQPTAHATLSPVSCQHGSIYIAGRYCKYSRELSQTPWLIDGQRKTETSVQEIICDPLQAEAKATDVKFCSSGREDVDVRMLGKGRPFCVELVDPKRSVISEERVAELQLTINNSSKDVQVRDLQMIDKSGIEHMKEGEADKIKLYRALILVPGGVSCVELGPISDIKELVLNQKTPLRVLHRRTLMDRQRTVHEMSIEPVDDRHFHLFLSTQAGTYIKEFVHGDMGRTTPNLGSLLQASVDIIELDVMGVELDWPPALS